MSDSDGSGGFAGLLIIAAIICAWIYFEPFKDYTTGFVLTCDSSQWKINTNGWIDCKNKSENWSQLLEIKFYPNKESRTVVEQNRKGSIKEYKNCTILDRKNWRCPHPTEKFCKYAMADGNLKTYGCDMNYKLPTKFEGWQMKLSSWLD